jgi:phage terminase small subunit
LSVPELLRWQWSGYSGYHRSRANLLMHIVVVPMFLAGNIGLIVALVQRAPLLAIVSIIAMVVSVAVQGRGHGGEELPPAPFTGRANAVSRILLEQWVTFPRFVLSGGWWRALRGSPGG